MSNTKTMVLDVHRTEPVSPPRRRRRRPAYVDVGTITEFPLRKDAFQKPTTFQLGSGQSSAFYSFSSVGEFSSDAMDMKHESHNSCGMLSVTTSPHGSLPV